MFNKILATIIISLNFGCKSYQTKTKATDVSYANFKQSQKQFNTNNGNLSYIDKGSGTPILLLHGVPTSGWLYRKMIDPLVAKGHRVIVPDMLGFGASDTSENEALLAKENQAAYVLDLMEHLQISQWHQVVHDAGGLWTWELLKKDASKINKLTLLNTIINKEGFKPPVKMDEGLMSGLLKWSYSNSTDLMVCQLFKSGTTKSYEMSKADIQGYKEPLQGGKTNGVHQFFTENTKSIPDYSELFQSLDIPTQVIWGVKDEILVWDTQSEKVISDFNIKDENIHLLEKSHFVQEEAPEQLAQWIADF